MKLIFVSSGQYPDGGAATNRHLAYAKGLKELGHDIEFLLHSKQQWKEPQLVKDGIRFTSLHLPVAGKPSKINKLRSFARSIRNTRQYIRQLDTKQEVPKLILLDTGVGILVPLLRTARKKGLRVFHERTEYPFVVSDRSLKGRIDLQLYLKYVVKQFDGIYVINNALKKYFSELTGGKVPVTIVNMIVDPARFACNDQRQGVERIIGYCGTLDGDKDGVPILIESFARIAGEFPSARLQLIGSLQNTATRQHIEGLIERFGITSQVLLPGSVKRDEMPALLCQAEILALARPANKQAEGGFPTKLGEYLATGNTVVVTNVGEIGLFLKDHQNAFVAEPDSADKFSDKLREALTHPDNRKIGQEGRKLVYNEFNYLTQARILEQMVRDH